MAIVLELNNISKKFPGVLALNNVDLIVEEGDVIGLLGENGAGKSTLMKIIAGMYQPTSGTIKIDGKEIKHLTPMASLDSGISVIYQELNYLQHMTVAENIFIGIQPVKNGLVDYKTLREKSKAIQDEVGLGHLDPFTLVSKLTTAEKQLLEIGRACARNTRILILDEPTSALNDRETEILFGIIRKLKSQNKSIIFISHRLEETFTICTKVQIMRNGEVVHKCNIGDITKDQVITHMVGRVISEMYPISKREIGKKIIETKNLTSTIIDDVSIYANEGEIVGIYGLLGAGCENLLETMFGICKQVKGEILVDGKTVKITRPADAMKKGIAYTPGERKTEGIILGHAVKNNISLATLSKYSVGPFIKRNSEVEAAKKWVDLLRIKTPSIYTIAESLSGGNQQKVILARWLNNDSNIFLLNEPTKGVDVGAKVEIYKEIEKICNSGGSIIFLTTDIMELINICDRTYVMYNGKINGEFSGEEITQENILRCAIGE